MFDSKAVFGDILSKITDVRRRVDHLETVEYIRIFPMTPVTLINNLALTNNVIYTTADLRGSNGISAQARGIFGTMWITPIIATVDVQIEPGNVSPTSDSQQYKWSHTVAAAEGLYSQFIMGILGPGGTLNIKPVGSNINLFMTVFAYWL